MTKLEVLNAIITITKETGQGVPKFMFKKEYSDIIQSLLGEGLIELYKETYAHLPDDEWLMPKGDYYNIYKESDSMQALTFVRVYLGIDDLGLSVKLKDVLKNPEFINNYSKWISKNEQKLKNLTDLKDAAVSTYERYKKKKPTLSVADKKWVKRKFWYKENYKVSDCLYKSVEVLNEEIPLVQQCNSLMSEEMERIENEPNSSLQDTKKLKEYKSNLIKNAKDIDTRKRVNDWLRVQKQDCKIKTLIKDEM